MAAPKGNKYALGLHEGRPAKYTDPKVLGERIVEYFDYIQGEEGEQTYIDEGGLKKNVWTRQPEPPTITGLTLFLGFSHKSSLYDYAKKEDFSDSIKRALTIVEQNYEFTLFTRQSTGAIFALKNMGWKDQKHLDHTSDGKELPQVSMFQIPTNGRDVKPED